MFKDNSEVEDLLIKIARCPEICKARVDKQHPCHIVVNTQDIEKNSFQLPEPWNGDLVNSKILFVSSNPSISYNEKYPTNNWSDEAISDFFQNRFSKDRKWVKKYQYPLQKDDTYREGRYWIRFWAAVRSIAKVILENENVIPGEDYALTEIVHCKSVSEKGVAKAQAPCSDRYLNKIIELSKAQYIVSLGKFTANFFREEYGLTSDDFTQKLDGKTLIILPHPNARGKRKEKLIEALKRIR